MSLLMQHALSRPLGVAQSLSGHPIDETAVYSKVVILTGEPAILATANGRWCFLDALALLSRVVGHAIIAVPATLPVLRRQADFYRTRAWSRGSISLVEEAQPELLKSAHAILNVGTGICTALPWTSINSNGWVARVSSSTALPANTSSPNAIAALMAASLGVTEVFKRVFEVPSEVAPILEPTEFSLWDLTTSPDGSGPPLPESIQWADMLLNGAGAIGNAIALLLAQLRIQGRAHIIDKQDYRDENMGTCMLMQEDGWLNRPKAVRLATWLRKHGSLVATGEKVTIEDAIAEGRLGGLAIDIVLNAFDDVDARRAAQRLWPSVIVDGGINEVGAAAVHYRLGRPHEACLMCWFQTPRTDEKVLQGRWTGLSQASLRDTNRQISEQDIATADESKREWLRDQRRAGKTVCSIITEAQLSTRLGISASEGFRPSVPFVASTAASLVVAEAVKAREFPESPSPSKFQIGSLFLGPGNSAAFERAPEMTCQCVTHRTAINNIHRERARRQAAIDEK